MSRVGTKDSVIIIGAGLVGSAVALHLAKLGVSSIRVIDFDLEGTLSSSELNAGGVRATWNQSINIEMSKLSIDYFSQHAGEVGYRDAGYLWLQRSTGWEQALAAREKQVAAGWPVEVWDVKKLREKVSFIDKTDDLVGAIFAPRDGLLNPNLLKIHLREEAKRLGVQFVDRTLLKSAEVGANGIQLICEEFSHIVIPDQKEAVLTSQFSQRPQDQEVGRATYRCDRVVNCAGAWANQVATVLGYQCPSIAVRRQVCIFDCKEVDLTPFGMMVDPSGVYFHPEAMNGLAGFATPGETPGANFNYDGVQFFEEQIWPALYERASGFERLRHLTGWAGLYEVSPDESAVIGENGRPGSSQIYEAHSFSGHGVMHCYAAGLALAELIVHGQFRTIDASILSGRRFAEGRLVHETQVI